MNEWYSNHTLQIPSFQVSWRSLSWLTTKQIHLCDSISYLWAHSHVKMWKRRWECEFGMIPKISLDHMDAKDVSVCLKNTTTTTRALVVTSRATWRLQEPLCRILHRNAASGTTSQGQEENVERCSYSTILNCMQPVGGRAPWKIFQSAWEDIEMLGW